MNISWIGCSSLMVLLSLPANASVCENLFANGALSLGKTTFEISGYGKQPDWLLEMSDWRDFQRPRSVVVKSGNESFRITNATELISVMEVAHPIETVKLMMFLVEKKVAVDNKLRPLSESERSQHYDKLLRLLDQLEGRTTVLSRQEIFAAERSLFTDVRIDTYELFGSAVLAFYADGKTGELVFRSDQPRYLKVGALVVAAAKPGIQPPDFKLLFVSEQGAMQKEVEAPPYEDNPDYGA